VFSSDDGRVAQSTVFSHSASGEAIDYPIQADDCRAGFSNWLLCRADARHPPFADGKLDVLLNGYILDLISLVDLSFVVSEFFRVLKPSGRMLLVNFSKAETSQRTWWECLYRRMPKRCAAYLFGGCRPVLMAPLAEKAGFRDVSRVFRPSEFLPTEIVTARKGQNRVAQKP
jgi:ubiquinone/menaquinone biosynthesis C-methylase UbiE